MAEEKRKKPDGRGGRRKGAGRKPDYLKKLGASPLTAAYMLSHHDELKLWTNLLNDKSADVRARTLMYLTDRRDGRPKQGVQLDVAQSVVERLQQARQRAREQWAGVPDNELEGHIKQIEGELGLTNVSDAPQVIDAPQRMLPAAPEQSATPNKPKPRPYSEPPPAPAIYMPVHSGHCDKHGPFSPKSKMEPTCPQCKAEWESADRADKSRMLTLMPGEPMWRQR